MQQILFPAATAVAVSYLVGTWLLPAVLPNNKPELQHHQRPAAACEGYWPDMETCLDLGTSLPKQSLRTAANAGCPQWQINTNWQGQKTFIDKLRDIEIVAREWEQVLVEMDQVDIERCKDIITPPVFIRRERGVAWSRIEENSMAGNSEFHAESTGGKHTCWTDALLPLYVERFGVEPSSQFQAYVTTFDLHAFRDGLTKLKGCTPE